MIKFEIDFNNIFLELLTCYQKYRKIEFSNIHKTFPQISIYSNGLQILKECIKNFQTKQLDQSYRQEIIM